MESLFIFIFVRQAGTGNKRLKERINPRTGKIRTLDFDVSTILSIIATLLSHAVPRHYRGRSSFSRRNLCGNFKSTTVMERRIRGCAHCQQWNASAQGNSRFSPPIFSLSFSVQTRPIKRVASDVLSR